jgi:hypothetical protein
MLIVDAAALLPNTAALRGRSEKPPSPAIPPLVPREERIPRMNARIEALNCGEQTDPSPRPSPLRKG